MKIRKRNYWFFCLVILLFSLIAHNHTANAANQKAVDYYAGTKRSQKVIRMVEKHHFNKDVQTLQSGQTNVKPYKDLDFVLRYVPNHPKALQVMDVYLRTIDDWSHVKHGMYRYYYRAIKINPNIAITRILFANYLKRQEKIDLATQQYKKASNLPSMGNSKFLSHYNLAQIYQQQGKNQKKNFHVKKAKEYAKGNKNLLKKIQKIQ